MTDATKLPLPAVVARRGPFLVRNSLTLEGASATPSQKSPGVFEAPLSDASGPAIAVRQHEYGHLAIAQLRIVPDAIVPVLIGFFSIAEVWVQAALDVLVNAFMESCGNQEIKLLTPISGPLPSSIRRWEAASIYLRCQRLSCGDSLRPELARRGPLSEAETGLLRHFALRLAAAGETQTRVSFYSLRRDLSKLQKLFGPYPGEDSEPFWIISRPGVSKPTDDPKVATEHPPFTVLYNDWGDLEVRTPRLPVRSDATFRGRGWKAARIGPLIFPHRAFLPGCDGRAFGGRQGNKTDGSVLIDCSGSMHLDKVTLARVLDAAPLAVVALYASWPDDMERGRIVVAAKYGHKLESVESLTSALLGKGNVVDGPALRYLISKCPAPRFWISDGVVTGKGDHNAANLQREVEELTKIGKVTRLGTLEEFLNLKHRWEWSSRHK